jgi:hypothetical protein
MQPLLSSTSASSVRDGCAVPDLINAAMFTADMSSTMTAMRRPARFSSNSFGKVVLPAPRNPDRTVTESFRRVRLNIEDVFHSGCQGAEQGLATS